MTDFFAQSLQALQERMRTPWIGSILIAFLLWNWQPLLFLLASDTALLTRFTYFKIHTGWCSLFFGPIATGLVFAALKPWISLGMDWLGAEAIHRSRLHADRLAAERQSKKLEQQKNLAKQERQIENEVIDQAIGRKTKIEGAQLDEDEKEQLQQKLRALQPTPEEQDVDPIDEETRARAIIYFLDERAIKILRRLARLESGFAQMIDRGSGSPELFDLVSSNNIHEFSHDETFIIGDLLKHQLITSHDLNLYKITDFGRKVASLLEKK